MNEDQTSLPASPAPSPTPDITEGLPNLPTKITVPEPLIKAGEKLTVGDVIEMSVQVPSDQQGLTPGSTTVAGPVDHGDGRILWVKENSQTQAGAKEFVFGLTCYKAKVCKFPRVAFFKDGKPTAASEPKEMEFSSVGKEEKPPEIYPPADPSVPWKIVILAAVLGFVLAGGAFYFLFKKLKERRARAKILTTPVVVLSPIDELESTLKKIALDKLVQQKKYKEHYFRTSEASKRFLSRQFSFNAEDRTTRELKSDLESKLAGRDALVAQWMALFEEMDIVKFTDQIPQDQDAASLTSRIYDVAKGSSA